MSINNVPFLNEDLKTSIKINIKLLFPNINEQDSEFLYKYSKKLVEKISKYFFFKNEEKYYMQWKQNNFRDIKGVILVLLPFIDDTKGRLQNEMTDLNQFLYNEIKDNIPDLKEKDRNLSLKTDFKFGNMSLGLMNIGQETPIIESGVKLIYKIIEINYNSFLKTLEIMNGKYYINWVNIVPLELDFKKSELYIKTRQGLIDYKPILASNNSDEIAKFFDSYYGLWFGNIYNVIKIKLYDEIKPIKFFLFNYTIKDKSIYLIDYLNEEFDLNLCFEFESYDDVDDEDKIKFTKSLKSQIYEIETNPNIFEMWKQILLFLCNDYKNRFRLDSKLSEKFTFTATNDQFDFSDDNENNDFTKEITTKLNDIIINDVIEFIKNIDVKHIWNFLWQSIRKLEGTYLKEYFIFNKKFIKDKSYFFKDTKTLSFKNIYNIAKSITHVTENGKWLSLDSHYISLPVDKQKLFFNRFLNNSSYSTWLNLRNNIIKEYGSVNYTSKLSDIYTDWTKVILDLIFDILNKNGVLNKFDVDLNMTDKKISPRMKIENKFKANPDYLKAYYYLTNEPFENLGKIKTKKKEEVSYFKLIEKEQLWFSFYAMDWLAQVSFFQHYIYHRVLYVTGATGQGKSTQVPKLLMYALKAYEFKNTGKVVCTQPRIPPTEGNSSRISAELGLPINQEASKGTYKVKTKNFYVQMKHQYNDHLKNNCPHLTLKIVTDGTLYEELKTNPLMKEIVYKENKNNFQYGVKNYYDIVILDESHEHNTNMDMILTLMRQSCYYNNSLRLIIVSATMDDDEPVYRSYFRCINDNLIYPIKAHDSNNKIIESIFMDRRYHISPPGETTQYRVVENYSENLALLDKTDTEASIIVQKESYKKILEICQKYPTGEILLFSTGQAEIIQAVKELNNILPAGNVALPYYSQLNANYKDVIENIDKKIGIIKNRREKIFTEWGEDYIEDLTVPDGIYKRAIIIATNVAEASITIETLKFVVDNGFAKVNSYDKTTGVYDLQVEKIAEASRVQRKGRIGRTSDGTAYFLYPKGSREKIVPKYKITQEDQTKLYLNLSIDETKKPSLVVLNQFNPNLINRDFYKIDKLNVTFTKDDFFTKNVYSILKKQYSIDNKIIDKNIYWNSTYMTPYILGNPSLTRDYSGQYIRILGDLDGSFYIIHPYENEIVRNIYNEIISFRGVLVNSIPDEIFIRDIEELQKNLILVNLNFNMNKKASITDPIVKTELYNKVIDLQRKLGDNSIDTNDCLTLFAAVGLNCFNEVLAILVFIKAFDRMNIFEGKNDKNFKLKWNNDCQLIIYYDIYNKLSMKFSNLLLFKIIKNPDELNKFNDLIKYMIKDFKKIIKKTNEPIEKNKFWEDKLRLFNSGNLETNKGNQQLKFKIVNELIKEELIKFKFEITSWCSENYLNFNGIFIFLEKLGELVLNVLTIEKNLDIDLLEISPLKWMNRLSSTFSRILKTNEMKERIIKSFILGRPLNYAIKINSRDNFYRLYKMNIIGLCPPDYGSIIFYYKYTATKESKNIVNMEILNNVPINYMTSCLPQIFNDKYFKTLIPIKTFQIVDKKFTDLNTFIELTGDNYDRVLNYVHNNQLSYSPWENEQLGLLYLFLKNLRKN